MTGEVTLRGRVLAIGGLKEKTMAALRNGMSTVILPQDNVKDLEEIDPLVRENLKFLPVTSADQVLAYALVGECAADQTCQTIITPDPGKNSGVAVNLCQ